MSHNNKPYISLDYSNRHLSEFPKELNNYKLTLNSLDISANPLIKLDKAIEVLKEFPSLKKLKINIETGDEAKKLIDALPNLLILNDHPIHEDEEEDDDNNEQENQNENNNNEISNINNKNDSLIKQEIAQLNFSSIKVGNEKNNNENNNNSNYIINNKDNNTKDNSDINNITNNHSNIICNNNLIINNNDNSNIKNINNINNSINNSAEKKTEIFDENIRFDYILNKIKEYSEMTKEQYELIIKEYNNLMNNNIKNTLEICSFFNRVLINLIKDAQEKNNIEISSIRPLLEAQTQNETIRINFEEKINLALQNTSNANNINNNNNYNNNHSYITIDSLRDKKKLIKTETNSNSQEKRINLNSNNLNSNLNNNNSINYTSHSNYKKRFEKNSCQNSNKILNKNELRKQYSNNIKNLSLSKIKKKDAKDSNTDKDRNNNNGVGKNITFSLEDYLSDKNLIKNKSFNNFEISQINKNEKKKFRFIQKTHSKKKINNKLSSQQDNIDTYSNVCSNINTDCNNKLNISQPNVIKLNNTNNSSPIMQASDNINNNHQYKNRIDYKAYNYMKKNYGSNDNNMKYLGKTISTISNDNYLSKYDLLKNCQENPTINSLLFQIDNNNEGNFDMSKIFDGLKDIVYYDYNNIHTINLKNLLEIINQIYKIRASRIKRQMSGSCTKGTLETDLMAYLKSKYGLKKLIIEWNINILSSIKAFSKISGEVCLFGLILKNELDEGSIDILFKIKETVDSILKALYRYDKETINNIKNNKEFMKENEWLMIAEILYNNDNNLRQRFQNKVYMFIKKFINNDKILEKNGKKIIFGDFLNQLIMFNLRLRKKYLNNLVNLFKKRDKERYGFINYDDFRLIIEDTGIFEKDKLKEVTDYLLENADKEGSGQITFNDIVICFDNFYLDSQSNNNNEDKIKLLDKINNLKLNIN